MNKLKKILIQQIKLFTKIKLLIIGMIGIIGLIVCFSLYYSSLGVDTLLYMQQMNKYSFYICSVFTIICFSLLFHDKKNDIDEALKVMGNHYRTCTIIILFFLLILISLIMFLMMIFVVTTNQSTQLFTIYIPSFLLNIFFPLCICLFISIILSYLSNYNIAGIVLIAFLMLISPLFNIWVGDDILQKILDMILQPFRFLYQTDEFSIDYMYGLKDELYRWFIILTYAILIIGFSVMMRVKTKIKVVTFVISVALASLCIGYSLKPQSTLNVDRSRYELMNQVMGSNAVVYEDYKEVDYQFGDFQFYIILKEQLSVKGTMKLESQTMQKKFVFTLYSGYDIMKLESSETSHFKRTGDIVEITFDKAVQKASFDIQYQGYHPTFYSNNQAVALPGYFPWYPMSGQHQISYVINSSFNKGYGYNASNRIDVTDMSLNIKADYPISSNLHEKSKYHYEGKADSITLFGGYIETGNDVILNLFPTSYGKEIKKEQKLDNLMEFYEDTLETLKIYPIKTLLENKKILSQPKSLTYFSDKNTLSVFNDYIIAKDGIITEELMIESFMNEMSIHSEVIYFLNGLPSNDIKKSRSFYKDYYHFSDNVEMIDKLDKILSKMSDEEFVNEFYSYGFGLTEYTSDQEFLETMEAKYDRD